MHQIFNYNNLDLDNFKKLAASIGAQSKVKDIYLLFGEMGAGKTTFVQTFASALEVNASEVTSPTFNLVHVYDAKFCKVWHYDLYRLNNVNEIYELGFDEAFESGIAIIEWPDIAKHLLPKRAKCIEIKLGDDTHLRNVIISN